MRIQTQQRDVHGERVAIADRVVGHAGGNVDYLRRHLEHERRVRAGTIREVQRDRRMHRTAAPGIRWSSTTRSVPFARSHGRPSAERMGPRPGAHPTKCPSGSCVPMPPMPSNPGRPSWRHDHGMPDVRSRCRTAWWIGASPGRNSTARMNRSRPTPRGLRDSGTRRLCQAVTGGPRWTQHEIRFPQSPCIDGRRGGGRHSWRLLSLPSPPICAA